MRNQARLRGFVGRPLPTDSTRLPPLRPCSPRLLRPLVLAARGRLAGPVDPFSFLRSQHVAIGRKIMEQLVQARPAPPLTRPAPPQLGDSRFPPQWSMAPAIPAGSSSTTTASPVGPPGPLDHSRPQHLRRSRRLRGACRRARGKKMAGPPPRLWTPGRERRRERRWRTSAGRAGRRVRQQAALPLTPLTGLSGSRGRLTRSCAANIREDRPSSRRGCGDGGPRAGRNLRKNTEKVLPTKTGTRAPLRRRGLLQLPSRHPFTLFPGTFPRPRRRRARMLAGARTRRLLRG